MTIYPTSALRTVALVTQGLAAPDGAQSAPDRDTLYRAVESLGCVQIDTLQMVRRSHYLAAWSRLGSYDPDHFDALTSPKDRRLFEGWQHAAAFIPLAEYRYQMVRQRNLREQSDSWYHRWLNDTVQKDFVPHVLERIRREGPLRVSDFESDGKNGGGTWWNWRPAKVALEFLFAFGELMIADRVKFQRLYDLTERILPAWVDRAEPTVDERDRFWVERGAKALGVCLPRHAGDYTWMKVSRSRPIVESLLAEGVLLPVKGKLADGKTADLIIHRDNLPLLQRAAEGELKAGRTTFLSPFDSLWWAGRRDEQFWGFRQALEAYLPAPRRIYGYFCLPILHKDRLVGRFDPKLERKTGLPKAVSPRRAGSRGPNGVPALPVLRLKALYLEPGVKAGEELVHAVAGAMRDFMSFHQAKELVIERSQPASFGKKLMREL